MLKFNTLKYVRIFQELLIKNCSWPDASSSATRQQLFSAWNDVMAAMLKLWRQIENPTPSVDVYLREE